MSSRGTKFGRKLCLAGFYHCWDYCLPRSLPVPLVGLVGWCQCGKWGSSDLGVLLMAFFTLSVVCSVTQDTSHMVGLSVHLLPQSCPRCCSFLLHDSTTLWLAEVLHFQAWSFSPPVPGATLCFLPGGFRTVETDLFIQQILQGQQEDAGHSSLK